MSIRTCGFFKETHGAESGPSIFDDIAVGSHVDEQRVGAYLAEGEVLLVLPEVAYDPIGSEPMAAERTVVTDGEWVWPGELPYFVLTHHLRVPDDFVEHMRSRGWRVGSVPDDRAEKILFEFLAEGPLAPTSESLIEDPFEGVSWQPRPRNQRDRLLVRHQEALSSDQRDLLLATHRGLLVMLDEAAAELEEEGSEDLRVWREIMEDRVTAVREAYRARVPSVPVSRNPITDEAVDHSLDLYGLDGLWWRHDDPIRPVEQLSATVVAFTGALGLVGEPESTPFPVRPGPGVPFVIPDLLAHPEVSAVLSSVPVGLHHGYVVVYYASDRPADLEVADDWGTGTSDQDAAFDFDLAPWIERRRLRWIAPGDLTLELRDATEGCPYLDLDGPRAAQLVQDGSVSALP